MNNCQDRPTLLPEALWKALMNLPALRYMKAPVNTEAELYEKYPIGNDKGTFAFVHNENTFYTYHPRGWNRGKWKPISADGISSFFEIDAEFLKEDDILVYDSNKRKFVVRSGNVWNKLLGDLNDSYSQVTKFLNQVDEIPTKDSDSGVYFVYKNEIDVEFRALYIVLGKKAIKIFNSSDYRTKQEVDSELAKKANQTQVDDIAASVDILAVTKADKSVVEALMNGIIKQPAVDTYNDTSNGQTSLLSQYPNPQLGWDVLVRSENTRYNWNGNIWVNMETGIYGEDVATKEDLDKLERNLRIYITVQWITGKFIEKGTGLIGTNTDYSISQKIQPQDGFRLTSKIIGAVTCAVAYYDINDNYLGNLPIGDYVDHLLIYPNNTAYFILTLQNVNIGVFRLFYISTMTSLNNEISNKLDIVDFERVVDKSYLTEIPFSNNGIGFWGGSIGQPMTIQDNVDFLYMNTINCDEQEHIELINFFATTSTTLLCTFADENNKVLGYQLAGSEFASGHFLFKTPIACVKIGISFDNRTGKSWKHAVINTGTYKLQQPVKDDIINSINANYDVQWITGKFIEKGTGLIGTNADYSISQKIQPQDGFRLTSKIIGAVTCAVAYYDINDNYLGNLPIGDYVDHLLIYPNNTAYFILTLQNVNIGVFRLVGKFDFDNVASKEVTESLDVRVTILEEGSVKPSDLQAYINENRNIRLGTGVWEISQSLIIPSNTKIEGIRGGTVLKLVGDATSIINMVVSSQDLDISGITFQGKASVSKTILTPDDIKNRTGAGIDTGIYAYGYAKNIHIRNCEFKDFSLASIHLLRTHAGPYNRTFKITNCVFTSSYYGLLSDIRSEYHTVLGCTFAYNQIGGFIAGGNNFMGTCHFDANSVGCVVSGTAGENDSHGSIVGSSFNHNLSYSIAAFDINSGFTFNGCHAFEGNILLDNAKGFNFVGGEIAAVIEQFNINTAINMFHSNVFFKAYGGGWITDKTKLSLMGNRFIDGSDSTEINN